MLFLKIFVKTVPYIFFGISIWSLFILEITISDDFNLLGYINIIDFIFNRILKSRFFKIPEKLVE